MKFLSLIFVALVFHGCALSSTDVQHSDSSLRQGYQAQQRRQREARCQEMALEANIESARVWCATEQPIRPGTRQTLCQIVEDYDRRCQQ